MWGRLKDAGASLSDARRQGAACLNVKGCFVLQQYVMTANANLDVHCLKEHSTDMSRCLHGSWTILYSTRPVAP